MILAVIGFYLWLAFFISVLILHREWKLHHGYFGFPLLFAMTHPWVQLVGIVFIADDLVQHGYQALLFVLGKPTVPDFTPIHKLGVAIIRWLGLPL